MTRDNYGIPSHHLPGYAVVTPDAPIIGESGRIQVYHGMDDQNVAYASDVMHGALHTGMCHAKTRSLPRALLLREQAHEDAPAQLGRRLVTAA
jgi:hypothetical protein